VGQFDLGMWESFFAVCGTVCCRYGLVILCWVWDSLICVCLECVCVCAVWDSLVWVCGSGFVLCEGQFLVGMGV